MKSEWTHEELGRMKRQVDESINEFEAENPNARPLPPLSEQESKDYLFSMFDLATERPLTIDEAGLAGQFLCCFRMAIEARMLGKPKGRYFVISEADLDNGVLANKGNPLA